MLAVGARRKCGSRRRSGGAGRVVAEDAHPICVIYTGRSLVSTERESRSERTDGRLYFPYLSSHPGTSSPPRALSQHVHRLQATIALLSQEVVPRLPPLLFSAGLAQRTKFGICFLLSLSPVLVSCA